MHHAPARIVLVTGGSRGIGAEVAQQLASPDTHVIVNYRERAEHAESIAAGHPQRRRARLDVARRHLRRGRVRGDDRHHRGRFGRLDALILNASVGLASGADLGYAKRLNRDAQRRLALRAVPLMPAGGRIVFVTSHQAHFFPHRAVPKGQTAVAASKWAGETALYAMRSEFRRAGVHFTVVSGDTGDATFAGAIVNAANTANPSGIVYVGGADSLMIA